MSGDHLAQPESQSLAPTPVPILKNISIDIEMTSMSLTSIDGDDK
jgi:hypothetical protein